MATLVLRLAGPLQSWGDSSRFTRRTTRHEPTKSGVVGLIAAALGLRREDDLGELSKVTFGVRVDQPGTLVNDFHTATRMRWDSGRGSWIRGQSLPLSHRYYLSDAVFVVGVEAPLARLEHYALALQNPAFPLYLGRRSCPPSAPVFMHVDVEHDLVETLSVVPWQASMSYRRRLPRGVVHLDIFRDIVRAHDHQLPHERARDVPISFSQVLRQYDWRDVVHDSVDVKNSDGYQVFDHDPVMAIEEV